MIWLYICLCVFVIGVFFYMNFNHIVLSSYIIRNEKLPKEFHNYRIVHLSDLHLKEFGKNNTKLIKKIDKVIPDVIFVTGDMVYKRKISFDVVYQLMQKLVNKYPVYYIWGNHESALKEKIKQQLQEKLEALGVKVLIDEQTNISRGNKNINLYGIDFNFKLEPKNVEAITDERYRKAFKKQIKPLDQSQYNILLAHDPLNYELYDETGFDLVFSGHVHGGALRVFGKAIFSPRRLLFPKYSSGVYQGKNGCLVVSRGLGNSTIKFRMFNFPQIVCVTLKIDKIEESRC